MKFYVGVGQQSQIMWVKDRFMLSFQVARRRKHVWGIPDRLEWIMDSGSYSELKKHGKYTFTPEEYFNNILLWQPDYFVNMDWMCEPHQLEKTGKTAKEHQELSLEHQIKLHELLEDSWFKEHCELMGIIQGWTPEQYVDHIDQLKEHDMILPYMGVGSVCRRAADKKIIDVIKTIRRELPDTNLHGFGVKTSLLKRSITYDCLDSVDSQAWCYTGWKACKNPQGHSMLGSKCFVHDWKKCHRDTDDCANCGRFMHQWVEKNLSLIENNRGQPKLSEFTNKGEDE
jgi:hypothetical protein